MDPRKGSCCLEGTAGKNINLKGDCDESSERKEETCRESVYHLRGYIYHHEQNISRNMHLKGDSREVSDANEEYTVGNWRKSDPCYKMASTWMNCILMVWGK